MENVRKHGDIKLVTTERRRSYLVSEPNYHTTKFFTEHLLAIEMKKTEILMNKPDYLGLSILDLSKILMYEFCMITQNLKYFNFVLLLLLYHKCYGFERAFFTLRHFLPYIPSQHLAQPVFIKASWG